MELIDVSLTLAEDLPTWPGDPSIELRKLSEINRGQDANVTHISMAVHAGTHVDAPRHFLEDGKPIQDLALDSMVGPAAVVQLNTRGPITQRDLEQAPLPPHAKRVLLKTPNSQYWAEEELSFQENFAALSAEAARYLVEEGIEVIGVDYLSVAPFSEPVPTHQILLEAGILIIEGLDLRAAQPGDYTLLCLPLKIFDADGAPARVLLMR